MALQPNNLRSMIRHFVVGFILLEGRGLHKLVQTSVGRINRNSICYYHGVIARNLKQKLLSTIDQTQWPQPYLPRRIACAQPFSIFAESKRSHLINMPLNRPNQHTRFQIPEVNLLLVHYRRQPATIRTRNWRVWGIDRGYAVRAARLQSSWVVQAPRPIFRTLRAPAPPPQGRRRRSISSSDWRRKMSQSSASAHDTR